MYKEDFAHFTEGLSDVIAFVQNQMGEIEERKEWVPEQEAATPQYSVEEKEQEEKPKRGILSRFLN